VHGLTPQSKKTAPTVGARPQPCKVEENKSKQQAPTGPTAGSGPQPCKVEPNNNKQQPTNQRTNEQEAVDEPENNICIFNDD
jgi:hypothetical protein